MYSNQPFQQNAGQSYENMHLNVYYPVTQQPFVYDINYSRNMHYNVYPSHVTCDNSTVNNATSIDRIRTRQEDEKAIEQFLQQTKSQIPIKNKLKDQIKITTIKNMLISMVELNKKLEAVRMELENNVLSEEEWQEKISACNVTKHEICEILKTLKEADFLNEVKKNLKKREKKRKRERLRREKWKKEKSLKEERRIRMHAEADSWIRKEQAVIEREKQEENLRKDADMILSDVRSKRSDARKYLGILQELQNLRKVKVNIARARGDNVSSGTDEVFNNAITKLTEQWTTLDHNYAMEEQELKMMLKTDNEKRIEKQTQNLFDDWTNVLFGTNIFTAEQSHKDVNSFIVIRTAWDKFTSFENAATTIPIGWIVPEKPSSAAWQKCLNKEISF